MAFITLSTSSSEFTYCSSVLGLPFAGTGPLAPWVFFRFPFAVLEPMTVPFLSPAPTPVANSATGLVFRYADTS